MIGAFLHIFGKLRYFNLCRHKAADCRNKLFYSGPDCCFSTWLINIAFIYCPNGKKEISLLFTGYLKKCSFLKIITALSRKH